MMIAPPHIRDMYDNHIITELKPVVPTERTAEEKIRDEEERVKLEEFYENRKKQKQPLPEGITEYVSGLDLEESIRKNKPQSLTAAETTISAVLEPTTSQPQRQDGAEKVKKPVKKSPPTIMTTVFGSVINPEPGPQMDCED